MSPGRAPSYLLSGLARFGECGGPIAVNGGKSAATPVKVYLCQFHRTRGDEVCASSLRRPVAAVDQVVIDYVARNVLTEDVITDALKILRQGLTDRTRSTSAEVQGMEADAKRLQSEIANLVAAIAAGQTKRDALVQAVADHQEKLSALDARIRAVKTAPEAISTELHRLEREARSAKRAADLPTSARRSPATRLRLVRFCLKSSPDRSNSPRKRIVTELKAKWPQPLHFRRCA